MEIIYNITKPYEKDFKKLSSLHQSQVVKKVNQYMPLYLTDKNSFHRVALKPHFIKIVLKNNYEPTLLILRVNRDIRLFFTIDEDPIFDQLIITLLRIGKHSDLNNIYKGLAESLYQTYLNSIDYTEET